MDVNEKIKLITRNCQEVLTEDDLKKLLESGTQINHYIGFEVSGLVHLGTGLVSMGKIADFLKAGVKCKIFLADFHSYLNNKLGGNWENIRIATEGYFKNGLIASLKCFGVDEPQVEFITGKNLYETNPTHWETFMEVGKHVTLSRNLRSISIMGKKQGNDVDMATLFYPPLQVADIFTMGINLAHAGTDQRKAHVIAREVAKKLTINPLKNNKGEIIAPVAIHHNLIAGLTGPENLNKDFGLLTEDGKNLAQENGDKILLEESLKMSKSKPNSAIFVHDAPDEIRNKIKKAYGPPKITEFNPLINWVETLVFWGEKTGNFKISRPEKFGGDLVYTDVDKLIEDYKSGDLFPLDLKNGLADWLIEKLEPARKHFEKTKAKEGLEKMKEFLEKKN
ncbi:MAG: tyrosine--tRNA ligase [Candidatus Shapirobacteria bacterium]|nr:tyrosine--tRNA ligase [Candidatus Shapirobacteria bacterium]